MRVNFKRPNVQLTWSAVAVAVYFAVICDILFFRALLAKESLASLSTYGLLLSTFALLVGVHLLLLVFFLSRYLFKPVVTLLLLGNAVALYFMSRFHVVLNTSMLRNVMQTDVKEARELTSWALLGTVLLFAVIPAVLLWTVQLRRETWMKAIRARVILAAAAAALILFAVLTSYRTYAGFFRENREARFLITPENYIASLANLVVESRKSPARPRIPVGENPTPGPMLAQKSARPVVFVLVVGETARAAEFSLDGYTRETNPSLRRHSVINFPHVDSCGTSTADSLPCMFSHFGRQDFNPAKGRRYESLLNVLQHAGFEILWRENNSGCKGLCDGFETEYLENANLPRLCNDGECFDEILLKDLTARIRASSRNFVVVLHQKGSHGPAYFRRYPPAFERFEPTCHSQDFSQCTQEQIRNSYDNTILYTDYVLGKLIDLLESIEDRDAAMLYVSDHGESLGEKGLYLHGLPYRIAPETQKHVPMILWMSPRFASRFTIDQARLDAVSKQEYSHDYLFHSILGLLDIHVPEYDQRRDLFVAARLSTVASGRTAPVSSGP